VCSGGYTIETCTPGCEFEFPPYHNILNCASATDMWDPQKEASRSIAENMHMPRLVFVKNHQIDRFMTTRALRIQVQWPVSLFYKFSDLSAPVLQVQWPLVLFTPNEVTRYSVTMRSCHMKMRSQASACLTRSPCNRHGQMTVWYTRADRFPYETTKRGVQIFRKISLCMPHH
jgi:hypothetical protein